LATASGSLYELIGVDQQATRAEIESACLRVAAANLPESHPDDPTTAAVTLRQVERAFEVLGDPVRRATYDRGLAVLPDEALAGIVPGEPVAPALLEASEPAVPVAEPGLVETDGPGEIDEPAEPAARRAPSLKRAMEAGFAAGAVVALIAVIGILAYERMVTGPDTPVVSDRHQAAAPRIPS
jgi:curved DNA-binding protein CbpA